jgi:hypothetical protein
MTPSEIKNELINRRMEISWLHACINQHLQNYQRPEYVPCRIRLSRSMMAGGFLELPPGEYDCESNKWGAIKVRLPDGTFKGIRPTECEVLQMRFNDWSAK